MYSFFSECFVFLFPARKSSSQHRQKPSAPKPGEKPKSGEKTKPSSKAKVIEKPKSAKHRPHEQLNNHKKREVAAVKPKPGDAATKSKQASTTENRTLPSEPQTKQQETKCDPVSNDSQICESNSKTTEVPLESVQDTHTVTSSQNCEKL